MAKEIISKEAKSAIRSAKTIIEDILKEDANEAETRRRVERIFENVLGYDPFKHLSRERAVKGAGDTEHMDFTVQMERGAKPTIIVELKRVAIDLSSRHVKQVVSYAIDAGCEWIILTNSREWRVYRVEFGQPPETKLLEHWDLLKDDVNTLVKKFELINFKNVKKGKLDHLWVKTKILAPKSLLAAILSEDSIKLISKNLKKTARVTVAPEDVVSGLRKILNESAAIEMDSIKICLPTRKGKTKKKESAPKTKPEENAEGRPSSNQESATVISIAKE